MIHLSILERQTLPLLKKKKFPHEEYATEESLYCVLVLVFAYQNQCLQRVGVLQD